MDTCDFECAAPRCQTFVLIDLVIFVYFFLEMLVNMVAMGVFGRNSYLSQPWNCLDFIIAVVGSSEYLYGKGTSISFSAVRTFRVLRPLRAINRVPSLKILVELLLESLPMLGNVLMFAFFIFFAFGVCGIQLWAGVLRHRCFFPEANNFTQSLPAPLQNFSLQMPLYYRRPFGVDYVCTPLFGVLRCDDIPNFEVEGSFCDQMFHDHDVVLCRNLTPKYTECLPKGPNPSRETISFDNIGQAWIAIFQIINLENWTEIFYLLQDAYSFWVWVYFVILIVIGTFFALNLCLVVITNHFQEAKSRSSRLQADIAVDAAGSIYVQLLDLVVYGIKQCFAALRPRRKPEHQQQPEINQLNTSFNEVGQPDHSPSTKPVDVSLKISPNGNVTTQASPRRTARPSPAPKNKQWERILKQISASRAFLRSMFEQNAVAMLIMGVIVINTLIMGAEHHQQPETLTVAIENINIAFTFFFALELLVKMYAFGFMVYIRDGFNMLDLIVVILNFTELLQGSGSGLFVLRAFRLVRLVKIIRFLPGLQRQLLVMMRTVDNVASFFLLVSLFLFIFAIMGMSLFGCQYCPAVNKYMRPEFLSEVDEDEEELLAGRFNETDMMNATIQRNKPHDHELLLLTYYVCPRTNFDTLPTSLFTVLQIFTQDSWTAVLKDGISVTSEWAGLYFVALVSIGNYILLNLLVAILVEGFSTSDDDSTTSDEVVGTMPTFQILSYHPFSIPKPKAAPLASLESLSDIGLDDGTPVTGNIADVLRENADEEPRTFCGSIWNYLDTRRHYSFFVLSPNNYFRRGLSDIVSSRIFDNVILGFIIANCLATIVERPSIKSDAIERRILDTANYTINAIFLLEAILKIIAHGFIIGKGAYLRDSWNALDFALVNCASVYLMFEVFYPNIQEAKFLEILRVIRLLRALRPLRFVNRAPGLKIVVETLLLSVKPIGNIIIITSAFFLIFGILGVQMFRGCFYKCVAIGSGYLTNRKSGHYGSHMSSESDMAMFEALSAIRNRSQCEALGDSFEWENESYNFDNLLQALMTLFVFATFDGWVDITRAGIDCVGVDQQPTNDYNPWRILYFISFLLIVCFFVVNMFVGVVVNNFEKVHKRVLAEKEAQRMKAKRAGPALSRPPRLKKFAMAFQRRKDIIRSFLRRVTPDKRAQPGSAQMTNYLRHRRRSAFLGVDEAKSMKKNLRRRRLWHSYLQIRLRMYRLFTHKYFELVLVGVTTLNVLIMAVEYYQMPRELLIAVRAAGYGFMVLLAIELVMKMIALGVRRCLHDKWTKLDLFILGASLVEVLFEDPDPYGRILPINPTIFRILRLVRIARVFRLLKTARGVRRLLDTVSQALPKVAHLSLVFFLLFFIYASLGVELFGKFTCPYAKCGGLSRHANFEHFGMALLTLFRIFTGDKWNGILKDFLHVSSDPTYCRKLVDRAKYGDVGVECRTAGYMGPMYFVSFVLASRFVLINVVIAVLMSQLQKSQHEEQDDSCLERRITTPASLTHRRAPPNSIRSSHDDLRNNKAEQSPVVRRRQRRGRFDSGVSNYASSSIGGGSSFRGGARHHRPGSSVSARPSHFSASAVLADNETSVNFIDESSIVINTASSHKRKSSSSISSNSFLLLTTSDQTTTIKTAVVAEKRKNQTTATVSRSLTVAAMTTVNNNNTYKKTSRHRFIAAANRCYSLPSLPPRPAAPLSITTAVDSSKSRQQQQRPTSTNNDNTQPR